MIGYSVRYRILEYLELEGTHKDNQVQLLALHRTTQKSNYMAECIVQMFLEYWQAQCGDYCLGEPVPMPEHPLSEEPFPKIQPEPPLLQLHAEVASCCF